MIPTWVLEELGELRTDDSLRELKVLGSPVGAKVKHGGRELVNFSSNDYLGLATDPRLRRAAAAAAEKWGAGAGASRLICGSLGIHSELEQRAAQLKGAESALVFSSGYQANQSIIQGLMREGVIFSDELNHASIVDGVRLAGAKVCVYNHLDTDDLGAKLAQHGDAPRKMIVTDGVFSMDGDVAPLPGIVELAREHGALLLVDDAHATGVLGGGRGTAAHFGLEGEVDVQMGTLGKALGSFGAFAALNSKLRELIINRGRAFIYTTALAPPAIGAALEALRIVEAEPGLVGELERKARLMAELLGGARLRGP